MLKYKMYIIGIAAMCLFAGCDNSNTRQDDNGIRDAIHYAEYSGDWSCEGKTHEQILAERGI